MARIGIRTLEVVDVCIPDGDSFSRQAYYSDLLNEGAFRNMFRIRRNGDTIEVPMFIRDVVERRLIRDANCNELIIPYNPDNHYLYTVKTPEVAIRNLFNASSSLCILRRVKCDDRIYLGMKGLLMNSDFDILFMPVLIGVINSNNRVTYTGLKIYINPLTVSSDYKVEKAVFSKIMPCIVSRGVRMIYHSSIGAEYTFHDYSSFVVPEVSITDITSRFIISPEDSAIIPEEDDIVELLNNNMNTIVNGICP